jgi:hypothetical protein
MLKKIGIRREREREREPYSSPCVILPPIQNKSYVLENPWA